MCIRMDVSSAAYRHVHSMNMCIDMCIDKCIDMCLDMEVSIAVYRHVYRYVCRHVCRHVFRRVCGDEGIPPLSDARRPRCLLGCAMLWFPSPTTCGTSAGKKA